MNQKKLRKKIAKNCEHYHTQFCMVNECYANCTLYTKKLEKHYIKIITKLEGEMKCQ